mmetsp:Transcript_76954/g.220401  ORF Transcript_76954/g.220401 Transcript_76954/m.220401 type:complete len:1104 (+) Transcript_76954:52-3363(+)
MALPVRREGITLQAACFKDLLLALAGEYEAVVGEVQKFKGDSWSPPALSNSSPWVSERLRIMSLGEQSLQPLFGPLASSEPQSLASSSIPSRPTSFRDRLVYCAWQYERLDEENRNLSVHVARLDLVQGPMDVGVSSPVVAVDVVCLSVQQQGPRELAEPPQPQQDGMPGVPLDQDSRTSVQGVEDKDNHKEQEPEPRFGSEYEEEKLGDPGFTLGADSRGPDVDVGRPARTSRISIVVHAKEQAKVKWHLAVHKCAAAFTDSKFYGALMMTSVIFALFAGGIWIVLDIPDDPGNTILTILLATVMCFFLFEIVLLSLANTRSYLWTFFFWMDLLGTLSIAFEISFLMGAGDGPQESQDSANTVLLRTARAAKLGTRVGRLFKVMKCLSVIMKQQTARHKSRTQTANDMEARVISQRLALVLSTLVSCLVIALTLFMPFTQIGLYPEADLSMRSWSARLETEYQRAFEDLQDNPTTNTSYGFKSSVQEMIFFYSELDYLPFKLEGYDEQVVVDGRPAYIPGQSLLTDFKSPLRNDNILKVATPTCRVSRSACDNGSSPSIFFDFTTPNGLEVVSDFVMIVMLMLVMVGVSFELSRVLTTLLVKPMERMLGVLHKYASSILYQVLAANKVTIGEGYDDEDGQVETDLLEDLMRKLAHVAQLSTQLQMPQDLESLDREGKGVIMEMMHVQVAKKTVFDPSKLDSKLAEHRNSLERISHLPVAEDVINSWNLNVLDFGNDGLAELVMYMFFDSKVHINTRRFVAPATMRRFHDAVRSLYTDLPYHCYAHACDVLHTVYRTLHVVKSDRWLSDIDQFALLVAALCHDLGHMGRTNPFLMETRHELALLYNDSSPLENMQCAKLFEIASHTDLNIFELADEHDRKQARKVCIAAILHTDNVHHMDMVRDISTIYEVNSETCDIAAVAAGDGYAAYYQDVLQKDSMKWLQLFLHLADVSNPLKPFKMCKLWAWRVLDEFFDQGDEEKRLGIPVGFLNDREKVNKPGSQHGFINFMVAPLVTSTVRLFPTMHGLSTQMASNLQAWRDLWVEDAKPSTPDIAKRDEEVAKVRAIAAELVERTDPVNSPIKMKFRSSGRSVGSFYTTRSSTS